MTHAKNFCGSPEHGLSRRAFLGGLTAGAAALATDVSGVSALASPLVNADLKKTQKRVILLWLAGGASQLETFDPKPGRPTGGPYRAIQTSVPGVAISELMPKMAARLHKHTAIIRSLNTKVGDHGSGAKIMMRGRRDEPSVAYPDMGAILARELAQVDSQVPDYVSIYSESEGREFGGAGFLGARYNPIQLSSSMMPENIQRLAEISELDHGDRAQLRNVLSQRFARGRETATLNSHGTAYARVKGLMASESLFDVSKEPQKMREKYGPTQFGEQAIIARRLVEAGVPFVRLARAWWDSHGQNFETHLELVADLDHVMCALLDDLDDRGLLQDTLVVTLSEFGRTPGINSSLGRDHFATAWSTSLSGCGVKGGAVYGKTDADGHKVADGEIDAPQLMATIFKAVGIDPHKEYELGSRPIPLVNDHAKPVTEILT